MPSPSILAERGELRSIAGFPRYWCDFQGRIYRKKDGSQVMPQLLGDALVIDVPRRETVRERPWVPVALLVARAWLPRLKAKHHHTHVVINLDRNPWNCAASNVAWVPTIVAQRRPPLTR